MSVTLCDIFNTLNSLSSSNGTRTITTQLSSTQLNDTSCLSFQNNSYDIGIVSSISLNGDIFVQNVSNTNMYLSFNLTDDSVVNNLSLTLTNDVIRLILNKSNTSNINITLLNDGYINLVFGTIDQIFNFNKITGNYGFLDFNNIQIDISSRLVPSTLLYSMIKRTTPGTRRTTQDKYDTLSNLPDLLMILHQIDPTSLLPEIQFNRIVNLSFSNGYFTNLIDGTSNTDNIQFINTKTNNGAVVFSSQIYSLYNFSGKLYYSTINLLPYIMNISHCDITQLDIFQLDNEISYPIKDSDLTVTNSFPFGLFATVINFCSFKNQFKNFDSLNNTNEVIIINNCTDLNPMNDVFFNSNVAYDYRNNDIYNVNMRSGQSLTYEVLLNIFNNQKITENIALSNYLWSHNINLQNYFVDARGTANVTTVITIFDGSGNSLISTTYQNVHMPSPIIIPNKGNNFTVKIVTSDAATLNLDYTFKITIGSSSLSTTIIIVISIAAAFVVIISTIIIYWKFFYKAGSIAG